MDNTLLFKACVKTIRLKFNVCSTPDKMRILQKKNKDFAENAKQIRFQITQLKNLLLENRTAYMQFAHHLKTSTEMTDDERDFIDRESVIITEMCMTRLNDFQTDCCKAIRTEQMAEFMDLVIETLTGYLSAVHQIANEQRQFRVQRELETHNFLKLNSGCKFATDLLTSTGTRKSYEEKNLHSDYNSNKNVPNDNLQKKGKLKVNSEDIDVCNSMFCEVTEDLSSEDIQIFESENLQLYNELKGLSDEVERIERNVFDIAHLQQIFTEKISLQKTDIDRIANTIVGTTENVKDANEQIKQAIQRNAGLRVWILFFLIVISLTLLFLDWYND